MEQIWQLSYILAALLIIFSIKWLSSPVTARRGVLAGQVGMLLAVIGTLLRHEVVNYEWILICVFIGAAIGAPLAYLMPMTAVPQLTALSHAFGALAAALVGTAEYYRLVASGAGATGFTMTALVIETVLGYLTCTASIMAFGKLQEIVPTRPLTYKGQNIVNLALFVFALGLGVWMISGPTPTWVFPDVHRALSLLVRWRAAHSADWRRRHADGDCAVELLRGRGLRCHGICALESLADCGRRVERVFRDSFSRSSCARRMNRSFTNVLFGAFRSGCRSRARRKLPRGRRTFRDR